MKLLNFFARIIQSDSKESSKRVAALWVVIVLVSFCVFLYTNKDNVVSVLELLFWFGGALFGLGVAQFAVGTFNKKKE